MHGHFQAPFSSQTGSVNHQRRKNSSPIIPFASTLPSTSPCGRPSSFSLVWIRENSQIPAMTQITHRKYYCRYEPDGSLPEWNAWCIWPYNLITDNLKPSTSDNEIRPKIDQLLGIWIAPFEVFFVIQLGSHDFNHRIAEGVWRLDSHEPIHVAVCGLDSAERLLTSVRCWQASFICGWLYIIVGGHSCFLRRPVHHPRFVPSAQSPPAAPTR